MDAQKLRIGAYYLAAYASTEQHVKELARCGIDVVVNMRNDRQALDLLQRYGVKAIVSGIVPGWFGGDGSNAGTMEKKNPLEAYALAAQRFENHPAMIGIDAGDEPSSLDFEHYGRVIDHIGQCFPGKWAYLNLYPRYALKGSNTPQEIINQLGVSDYRAYIDQYVKHVKTPYICFDYYLYSADLPGLYESLAVVSRACREHDREMWMVLQVNSHQPDVFISENQLRFQANCALAFGARTIIWACYCAGWWYNHVLDREGNPTEQYEKLRRVNERLHHLGEIYMKYRHEETFFVGEFTTQELQGTGSASRNVLDSQMFKGLHAEKAKLLVGKMKALNGRGEALLIAGADDPVGTQIKEHQVIFGCDADCVLVMDAEKEIRLEKNANGLYSVRLSSCDSILLRAEEE